MTDDLIERRVIAPAVAQGRNPSRGMKLLRMLSAGALAGALGAALVLGVDASRGEDRAQAEQQQAADNAQQVAGPFAEACRTDPDIAARFPDDCARAAQVAQEPTERPDPPVGLDLADVRREIDRRVNALPAPLTPDVVTGIVVTELDARRAAVEALVRQEVARVCADDACVGQPGEDAPPVTQEEIDAAVAAQIDAAVARFCDDGRCTGQPGPQGVGYVGAPRFEGTPQDCRAVYTLLDPATGLTSESTTPLPGAFCDDTMDTPPPPPPPDLVPILPG